MTEQNYNPGNEEKAKCNAEADFSPDSADVEQNKTIAGLAYFLFFLPLLVCPQSQFGKFHANQSLLLLIVAIAGNIILSLVPVVGWVLLPLFSLGVMGFGIYGLINGLQGRVKRLPLIGNFDLLK